MFKDKLKIYTLSVVLLGDFNPVIIQPFWLAEKKIIGEKDAENAKGVLIHPELVKFDLGWAYIEITKNRFEIRSSDESSFERIRDLVLSVFSILKETPLKTLGVNHLMHFTLTKEEFYNFGCKLVPFKNWENILDDPRVLNLEMYEEKRKDGLPGVYRVKILGSEEVKEGVLININDSFKIIDEKSYRKGEILKILAENWESSFKRAADTTEKIWNVVKN